MADTSDMPPLVDAPESYAGMSGAPMPAGLASYPYAPQMMYPPPGAMPGVVPGAGAEGGTAWMPFAQPPPMMFWPGTPGQMPMIPPPMMMTPGANNAAINPAMPPRSGDDSVDDRYTNYFSTPKTDDMGFPSARTTPRTLTPFLPSPSTSDSSSPSSTTSGVSRSRSVRSMGALGARGDESSKRPPREWRPDFSMSRSISGALGSIFSKARTASISGASASVALSLLVFLIYPCTAVLDSSRMPKLHPFLRYTGSAPSMHYDLRQHPLMVRFRSIDRPVNEYDLTRFVCEPPQVFMRLYCARFPWYIDVDSKNPTGVTLHELFSAIYVTMMTPISQADYWNNEMDESVRERIARAWSERCDNQEERNKGVRRVDFLMERFVFEGLFRGKDGMWEMKVKKL
ncbi:uncharacterized protein FIBRA_04242 [Fibroporia radiculosa]|uniref:DUF6699 domain-containing protein n=1 Tax=Fibroporia radiculosa TaxID=599839 RepID=J4H2V1_9APHY|nr:uncharacterized protein FIBRA_04242 [Fibroporia radiculosa]CCM02164.1 predicted protein [Fibroporia radiculosa]